MQLAICCHSYRDPQTKLFGRSPAGENSTGEGRYGKNYYGFIGNIQELNLKKNIKTVIDIILSVGKVQKKFDEIPDYNLEFKPLWNMDEKTAGGYRQGKKQIQSL